MQWILLLMVLLYALTCTVRPTLLFVGPNVGSYYRTCPSLAEDVPYAPTMFPLTTVVSAHYAPLPLVTDLNPWMVWYIVLLVGRRFHVFLKRNARNTGRKEILLQCGGLHICNAVGV